MAEADAEAAAAAPPPTAPAVQVNLGESARRSVDAAPSTITTTISIDDTVGYELSLRKSPAGDIATLSLSDVSGSIEVLLVGPDAYVHSDGLPNGATWVQMRMADLNEIGIDATYLLDQPATAAIEAVAAGREHLTPIGPGPALDAPTAMYRFTADAQGLVEQALASGLLGGDEAVPLSWMATVEVLADDIGRLAQVSYEQTLAQRGQQRTVRVVEQFSGFGDGVDIDAPAPGTSISLDELTALDPAAVPQRS